MGLTPQQLLILRLAAAGIALTAAALGISVYDEIDRTANQRTFLTVCWCLGPALLVAAVVVARVFALRK